MSSNDDRAARARAWHHAAHEAVCDVIEPWEHGTIARATEWPSYFDFNVVRVEEDPGMSVDELAAFVDEALAGLPHRRLDVESLEIAAPLLGGFRERGWLSYPLVWMLHEGPPPREPDVAVEAVAHEAVDELRLAWHREDFPDEPPGDYLEQARHADRLLGAQVFAVRDDGVPVAFAQVERIGQSAEVSQVFVRSDHRGRGLGTALTCAAMKAAGEVRDLWIVADDDGRAKDLYSRLGFRPVWRARVLLRLGAERRTS